MCVGGGRGELRPPLLVVSSELVLLRSSSLGQDGPCVILPPFAAARPLSSYSRSLVLAIAGVAYRPLAHKIVW